MKRPVTLVVSLVKMAFRNMGDYFSGAIAELRLVTWPSRMDLMRYTIITLVTIGVSVTVITGIDYGLQLLSQRFLIR